MPLPVNLDVSMEVEENDHGSPSTPREPQMSPSSHQMPLKATLTPATMSSATSSPSLSSPIDPADVGSGMFSLTQQNDALGHPPSSSPSSVWVPLPSPSRPRLDPRYAARLAPELRISSRERSGGTPVSDSDLMPPPGIARNRNCSIFRPGPIATSSLTSSANNPPHPTLGRNFQLYNHSQSMPPPIPTYSSTMSGSSSDSTPNYFPRSYIRSSSDVGVSDRYIPNRATSNFNFNLWETRRSVSSRSSTGSCSNDNNNNSNHDSNGNSRSNSGNVSNSRQEDRDDSTQNVANPPTTRASVHQNLLNTLLHSELLGENANPSPTGPPPPHQSRTSAPLREGANFLRYQSPRQLYQGNVFEDASSPSAIVNSFSLTPVGSAASQRLMASPPKRKRRISKVPFKVLDAPALQDDFYLNLVDWSSQNVLAVGLASCVYLWSACTSKVTKLCDLSEQESAGNNNAEDMVTSVSWAQRGTHLAVGTNRGQIQLWDTIKCQKVRDMAGHHARVGTLAWSGPTLASGSRDRFIYLRDVRTQGDFTDKLTNHKQEVCGLKWSFDEPAFLASGGNDNNLHVIDSRNPHQPIHRFAEHSAAVKAIAWSPHQHGVLASGGGTADRCIRFWNTLSGTALNKIDTGSQVCNLAWSQNCNEIVSTHGYSLNQIVVWRYPSMNKVATLTGHTYRVLYLAMSPDGSTVVTGAGDETLRFWQIFPGPRSDGKDSTGGLLFPNTLGSVIR